MSDATLDNPVNITASAVQIEEIVIRAYDLEPQLVIMLRVVDSNGNIVPQTEIPRRVVVNPVDFNTIATSFLQSAPRKKLLQALLTNGYLEGVTVAP